MLCKATVITPVCILVIRPPPSRFALAVFFIIYLPPDDCAKSLPLATLNLEFMEKE